MNHCLPANGVSKTVDCANGVGSAWGGVTRVWFFNAALVLTDKSIFTVRVTNAFGATSGNGVRLGYQPLLTPAIYIQIFPKYA